MDKKSFIRGFGIGILFTAMILGISCMIRTSDSAVVRRARELGMEYGVKEESLFTNTEAASKGAASKKDGEKTEKTKEPARTTATPEPTKKAVSGKKSTDDTDPQQDKIEQEIDRMEQEMEEKTREITIQAGEWSSDVSRRLEAMDIVSDADEFDSYLEEHGYSDDIKAGTFTIPADATYEEIAKAITTK